MAVSRVLSLALVRCRVEACTFSNIASMADGGYFSQWAALQLQILLLFFWHAAIDGPRQAGRSPIAWIAWLRELCIVLALERARRIDVLDAGGEEALRREPERMFAQPLPHLKHLVQLQALLPSFLSRARAATGSSSGWMAGSSAMPVLKELVLVGGGHAHVHVLRMWGMRPVPGVRLTLVTRDVETPYSGMLPGHVAGQYTRDECHLDLVRLCAFARARLVHAEVVGVELGERRVLLSGKRPSLRFDVLSLNIGCTPRLLDGASGHDGVGGGSRAGGGQSQSGLEGVTAVKPIDGFGRRWDALLARAIARAPGTLAHSAQPPTVVVAIVGGGGGGVELALAVHARLSRELGDREPGLAASAQLSVVIVARSAQLMPNHAPAVRARVEAAVRSRGVRVMLSAHVLGCSRRASALGGAQALELQLADGRLVRCDESIWCTDGAPQPWLARSGLALDAQGFLETDGCLRVGGLEHVFAAGDVASIAGHKRPRAGVFAVRAGPPLVANLNAALEGRPPSEYVPQASFLGLIGTGDGSCIASRGSLALEAPWLWQLKEWIDRKWMHSYGDGLPAMPAEGAAGAESPAGRVARSAGREALELLAHAPMRCGGCASKVAATVLSRAMGRLAPPTRRELVAGVEAADDCAVWEEAGPGSAVSVHTVDYFRAFVSDPYMLGRIAAVHALSDCHAMGAEPTLALALVTLPLQVSASAEEDLLMLMAGACEALAEAGCALGGGHTSEGPETGIGFAVTGRAPSAAWLLRKSGMVTGHAIVLSKPLGTGVLFAALMRHAARGRWVEAALRSMCLSNGPAALILREHGASACTDVTGFGLCGHLLEMCRASERGALLELDALPLLDGALECVRAHIFSSLAPANMQLRHGLRSTRTADPRFAMLFDPQTSGGLLASVPVERADACVAALRASGCAHAAIIGSVTGRADDSAGPLVLCA